MARRHVVCSACGYRGEARGYGCMQVGILLFLMIFGILPGILYALYMDAWVKRCPNCDQKTIIPADSPVAMKMGIPPTPPQRPPTGGASQKSILSIVAIIASLTIVAFITFRLLQVALYDDAPQATQRPITRATVAPQSPSPQQLPPPQPVEMIDALANDPPRKEEPEAVATSDPQQRPAQVTKSQMEFIDARRTAPRFYFDDTTRLYHAQNCVTVERTRMMLATEAVARLKGYSPHSCVGADRSGSVLR